MLTIYNNLAPRTQAAILGPYMLWVAGENPDIERTEKALGRAVSKKLSVDNTAASTADAIKAISVSSSDDDNASTGIYMTNDGTED